MSTAKKLGYLLVLALIGLVSFALFGAIHASRVGTPLHLEANASYGKAVTTLRDGATAALRKATERLGAGRRGEATHAMDAAGRVIEVGAEAFGGAWHEAAKDMKHAKHAMANGRPAVAADAMHAAMRKLGEGGGAGRAAETDKPLSAYDGATLINAAGVRIGEVTDVGEERGKAWVALGGVRDLFGFWDLGGQQVEVPVRALVYGPNQWPKPTLVAAPTLASEPARIQTHLQNR